MPRGRVDKTAVPEIKPVGGQVRVSPAYRLSGTHLVRSLDREMIVGDVEIDVLQRIVVVPVDRLSRRRLLAERQIDGWSRVLDGVPTKKANTPAASLPIILSCRRVWHFENGETAVYDNALVVDGAKRLMALIENGQSPARIAFTAFVGLSHKEELELRANGAGEPTPPRRGVSALPQVGSSTQRLVIGVDLETFVVESDPIVVPTAFGYSAAILVRRSPKALLEHVLIQAKSVSEPLERIRRARGTLIGVKIGIRKESADRTSTYIVRQI